MNSESPVTLQKINYRGVVAFQLRWLEAEKESEASFPTEAEAVMEMTAIEERLRVATLAGQGLTVNPFGMHLPFINSKDVHYASLKLQPRGLKFRESIDDYLGALVALKGLEASVTEASAHYAEARLALKPFDVSPQQALFEWLELKKHLGDRPLYEVLRVYLKAMSAETTPEAAEPPAQGVPADLKT
ncbi:MAG: hypothetical protein K0R17_3011 [Rariglobus sp.]|jgi:hypothetical protein|nr:hypothetical protein [Rariglobus sp.]